MMIKIGFPGNKKVSAQWSGFTVMTDQPREAGGDGSAPAPFELFLASIGACAGYFALSFCRQRDIPAAGLEIIQEAEWDPHEHRVRKVRIEVALPDGFPDKYRAGILNAVDLCTVKKHLKRPPEFELRLKERLNV